MGAIQLLRKVRKVEEELPKLINEVLDELSDWFIELNQRKLLTGTDINGFPLGNYTNNTVESKRNRGTFIQPEHKIALKDTGSFYAGFKAAVVGDVFAFDSSDSKLSDLINEYGVNIFGIPETDKFEVSKRFSELLLEKIKTTMRNA